MRSGGPPNNRRPRSRHHNGGSHSGGHSGGHSNGGGNNGGSNHVSNGGGGNRPRSASSLRHQTFDSNSIDVRVRGNAWQVHEKYQALARDAQASGDRVGAENYLQHAEHYYRIIEAINEATALETRTRGPFNQQPETPPNYYADGNAPQPNISGNIDVNAQPQPPMATQAEVQPRAQSPFFTNEEAEENSSQPLAVNS
jgi:hypothetical protein